MMMIIIIMIMIIMIIIITSFVLTTIGYYRGSNVVLLTDATADLMRSAETEGRFAGLLTLLWPLSI
jgi:hypothetical protein